MDSVSVAIIVTVLSVGSLLVYLFQSDYERRQRSKLQQNAAPPKRTNNNRTPLNGKAQVSKPVQANQKQVPSEAAQAASQTSTTNSNSAGSNPTGASSKNHTLWTDNSVAAAKNGSKSQQTPAKATKRRDIANSVASKAITGDEMDAMDPPSDELDSSILMSVFSQPHSRQNRPSAREAQSTPASGGGGGGGRKASRNTQNSGNSFYSAEQLLNIIAASTLSKDEVELAIETLLNKVESGESNWKQPKSDPLQRLKSQLRDIEFALQTEVQNHEYARAHSIELRGQLQSERFLTTSLREELSAIKKEFGFVSMALEQTRDELSKQQLLRKQLNEERGQVIKKLEQDKAQLQSMLANSSANETEVCKLRAELSDKMSQLKHSELSNHAMAEEIQKIESKLCKTELQLDQLRTSKQHDNYEACAKIAELESDRSRLDKAVKDHVSRLREVAETNNLLEKSVKELQLINTRQDDMLKRLRDERHVNEASMKRTLSEMEHELKELQSKLSANSSSHEEKLRKEMSQVEKELNHADEREQKLQAELKELREGLSALLPVDVEVIQSDKLNGRTENWVQEYLAAFKRLSKTFEELRESNNNNNNNLDSPSRSTIDKSTSTPHSNGNSSRVGSPTSNGRSSRAGSHKDHDHNNKRVAETKLLELSRLTARPEKENRDSEEENQEATDSGSSILQQQIKDLTLQRNKLEAQIKFGLDSLKMEQERARRLEEELARYTESQ